MQKTTLLKTNTLNLHLTHTEQLRPIVALLSIIVFSIVTVWGFSMQYHSAILFNFPFSNTILFVFSVIYIITISQYFLLNENTFFYYSLYLFATVFFHHLNTSFFEDTDSVYNSNLMLFKSIILVGSYYLYVHFTINFLSIPQKQPLLHKRLRFYGKLFLVLMVFILFLFPLSWQTNTWNTLRISAVSCCIPLGLVCITDCIRHTRGRLFSIFLLGSSFYYIGSVLGFLFSLKILKNPFTNSIMDNWTFFTQTGTLLEVIFFSSGLAYRMRLIEIQKNSIEQELLKEKVKELEVQHALLKQRERISHDLHDDVGGTLNSISVFSEIARLQIQHIHPEASPMLERIGEASRDLVTTINDIVWAVNPKNDQFENITLRMRLFAADLLMPKNVDIDFQAEEQLNAINLSVDKRKQFYLVFKEAVNNVYKYAACSTLEIHITLCGDAICMTIADNGKGFDLQNPKNGNGLQSMQERTKILRGVLSFESALDKGTKLSLCFPIEEEEDEDENKNKNEKLPESVVQDSFETPNFVFQKSEAFRFWFSKTLPRLAHLF
jgi:signal transduction histidine kinase